MDAIPLLNCQVCKADKESLRSMTFKGYRDFLVAGKIVHVNNDAISKGLVEDTHPLPESHSWRRSVM